MTKREFYTAVIGGTITDEHVAFAQAELTKMDEALEKRKLKNAGGESKKAKENAPVLEAITNALTCEVQLAPDIAAAVGVSTQKASALLRQLVASGVAVQTEVKVPKKGVMKGYTLAPAATEDVVEG